uniref:Natural cytotoxicity triggering receptor 3 n=1 Tax=Xenopus tropicalis TaxID=8364 RepID=A0A6I8SEZ7_XENTR
HLGLGKCFPSNIEVSQIPEVNAIEGSTANLECSYNLSNLNVFIGWFKWYRHVLHGVEILKSNDFKYRITKESREDFLKKRSASIQLHRVKVTDTGMYFCEVEFSVQEQMKGHGKGTFLNVTATGGGLSCSEDISSTSFISVPVSSGHY